MKKNTVLLLIILAFAACDNTAPSNDNQQAEVQEINQVEDGNIDVSIEKVELKAILDNVRIRDIAGLKGKEIETVSKDAKLFYQNEMSDFTDEITLRGIAYNDPWLKVKTEKGKTGWVYAGAVKFDMTKVSEDFKTQMVTKRLEKVFGNKLVFDIEQYQNDYGDIKTDKDFVLTYRNATKLQEKLNEKLEEKFDMYNVSDFPDLFWIDDAIPALNAELVGEGTMYHLLFNYKALKQVVTKTASKFDDEFVNLLISKHNGEFEYFFPVWFLQTWDYGGYSLLGQGKHIAMLNRMQKLANKTDLFNVEITAMKEELLNDITTQNQYGEEQEKIIVEINDIIKKNYTIISNDEIIGLKTRIKMFEDPAKHEIEVFLKDN